MTNAAKTAEDRDGEWACVVNRLEDQIESLSRERDHWLREAQRLLKSGQECLGHSESLSRDLADERARHTRSTDYSIDLQRIIEDLCHGRTIREPQTTARYHYDMAVAAKAAMESRARSVLSTQPKETPDG